MQLRVEDELFYYSAEWRDLGIEMKTKVSPFPSKQWAIWRLQFLKN